MHVLFLDKAVDAGALATHLPVMHWLYFIFLCLFAVTASARPISYAGGYTAMQTNDKDAYTLHLHYSPTPDYSIGYRGEYWRARDWHFHGAQLNYLLARVNATDSQMNVYLKSGAGLGYSDAEGFDGATRLAGFAGLAADWENRRYFLSYENRATHAGAIDSFFMQRARVGVAPYIAGYGELHSWLMLQAEHDPGRQNSFTVTPMLRVFTGKYLGEVGISHRGDVMLNWITRF